MDGGTFENLTDTIRLRDTVTLWQYCVEVFLSLLLSALFHCFSFLVGLLYHNCAVILRYLILQIQNNMNSFQLSATPTSATDSVRLHNIGGSAGSVSTNNSTKSESDSGISGSAPTLTFTPSGAAGTHVSSFHNIKTTAKSLTSNVEASLAVSDNFSPRELCFHLVCGENKAN